MLRFVSPALPLLRSERAWASRLLILRTSKSLACFKAYRQHVMPMYALETVSTSIQRRIQHSTPYSRLLDRLYKAELQRVRDAQGMLQTASQHR